MSDNGVNWRSRLNTAARYALAVAAAVLAMILRVWLTPFLGDQNRFHTAWAAVAFCAWYCGLGPSILAAVISAVGVWVWFDVSDLPQIALYRMDLWATVGFLLFSAAIIAFGETARRSKARAERSEQSLREKELRLRLVNQDMLQEIQRRTAELEQKTAKTVEQARFLDLANDAILVRDAGDRISYWNQGAERLYGWTKEAAIGRLTHELLHTILPVELSEIAGSERWEGELLQVRRDGSPITVASRWTTLHDDEGKFSGWLEINTDITARKRLEEAARRLTGRILSLQDAERRRIARDLHDSLGQYLASIKVNLDLLAKAEDDSQQSALLSECISSTEQCLIETRTISHLLHPPLLDEAGFVSAARWYVEGFAQRSAFEVDLDFPPELRRLDRDVETALFRVLQESLTNVHRHSGGSTVRVLLRVDNETVRLEIKDNGKGISPERLYHLRSDGSVTGVGLAGMRERVRELGGVLRVVSSSPGTTVIATIPVAQRSGESAEEPNRGATAA